MTGMISRDLLGVVLALIGAASAGGLVLVGRRSEAERVVPRPSVVGWRVAESMGWLFAAIAVAAGIANLLG